MIQGTKVEFFNKEMILKRFRYILDNGKISNGDYCRLAEAEWQGIYNFKQVFCCGSGTEAIELALRALLPEESKIISIPALSPPMLNWAIEKANKKTKILDVNKETFMLDYETIFHCNNNLSAVIVVHVGGWICPDIVKIARYCKKNNIILIEDCSHCHGSTIGNRLAGTFGDAAIFSFYATKVLNCGEGGLVCFNKNPKMMDLKAYINQGRDNLGHYKYNSYNYRMTELQGALMYSMIIDREKYYNMRKKIAEEYNYNLTSNRLERYVFVFPNQKSTYYKYILKLPSNNGFFKSRNITLSGQVWDKYGLGNFNLKEFPNTQYIINNHICLPIYPSLKDNEIKRITEVVKEYVNRRICK